MRSWGRELPCETCQGETVFEVPPCEDGHGADCPELVCTGCGTALLLAPIAVRPPVRSGAAARTGSERPAYRQRRAA